MKVKQVAGVALLALVVAAGTAGATGVLGTPGTGSTVSGVGVISGYHCSSQDIEIRVDGVSLGYAGAGTTLLGTQGVCGRTDTGFSLLYNFNNLQPGQHVVEAYADGVLFGSNSFVSAQSGGVPWLSGASKSVSVQDFPQPGKKALLEWVQSNQNFLVTRIDDNAAGLSELNGSYLQQANITKSGSSCYLYDILTGTNEFVITFGTAVPSEAGAYVYALSDYDVCLFVLTPTSGNSSSGLSMSGSMLCASDPTVVVPSTATGLKKHPSGTKLQGTVKATLPGCTETVVLQ